MAERKEIIPVVSTACQWPTSAFWSLERTQHWAEKLGRKDLVGFELIPSWGLLAEVKERKGKAILETTDLVHDTFWKDRRLEDWSGLPLKLQNWLLTLPSLPPSLAKKATFALAAETVPVTTHWPPKVAHKGEILTTDDQRFNQKRLKVVGELPAKRIAEIHPQILLTGEELRAWVEEEAKNRGVALPLTSDVRYQESGHLAGAIPTEQEAWTEFSNLLSQVQVLYWKLPKNAKAREAVVLGVKEGNLNSPIARQMRRAIERIDSSREEKSAPLKIILNFRLPEVNAAGGDEFLKQAVTFIRLL